MFWFIAFFLCFAVHGGKSANDGSSKGFCAGHGWTVWKGNCYKLFAMPESMDFSAAQNLCREFGSHAASVHSDAENQFLASFANETFHLLATSVPVVNGQPLHWDRIHGGLWIGYRRRPSANPQKYDCSWVDGTAMDYAYAPLPDSVRQQIVTQAHWMGYPWEGPNPGNFDPTITICGTTKCPAGVTDQCVEMLNWPGSPMGTWNDLSCTGHKLSGVFCKKPVNCA